MAFLFWLTNVNATWIPRDWLIGEWLLDWNTDDTSGNGKNGVKYWSSYESWLTSWQSMLFENSNNVGFYDKKDYVVLPNISVNDFSISLWTKYKVANNFDYNAALFSIWDWTNWPFFWIKADTRNWNLISWLYSNGSNYESSSFNVNDNSWHHIIINISDNSMILYVDNNYISSVSIPNIIFSNQPSYISYHQWFWWTSWSSRYYWNIDNFRIYNRVITSAERESLRYELIQPSCSDWILNQDETSIDLGWICWNITRNWLIGEWLLDWNADDTSWNWLNWTAHNIIWADTNFGNQEKSGNFSATNSYITDLGNNSLWSTTSPSFFAWIKPTIGSLTKPKYRWVYFASSWWHQLVYVRISDYGWQSYLNFITWVWNGFSDWASDDKWIPIWEFTPWQWYNIWFTQNGRTINIYLNWELYTTYESTWNFAVFNWTFYSNIGGCWWMPWYEWDWNIQGIRIYNRALSNTEIQALYNEWSETPSSWRRSCFEQKSSTNIKASIVNINWKNAIKVSWQNPDSLTSSTINKNYLEDISLDKSKSEYLDYNIELWKKYNYYIKSSNSCWNSSISEYAEITYNDNPVFELSSIDSSSNTLKLFITKYGNFWGNNLKVAWYLTNNSWFIARFEPKLNESYNYWYLKTWDYLFTLQVEDYNTNTYKNYKIEKNIKITNKPSSVINLSLTAEDSWPDYIDYKYSVITKSYEFKNTNAKISLLDANSKKIISQSEIVLNSDSAWTSSNTVKYKEWYLESNKIYKRILKLTIWDSSEPIYSWEFSFKVGELKGFELHYDTVTKKFSWDKVSLPNITYIFQCKSSNWWANIAKQIKNITTYTDIDNIANNWGYVCSVTYFKDGYVYKSNEKIFGAEWKITKEMAYKWFMDIYNDWEIVDYDKEALRLWIINKISEKTDKIKWIEYTKLIFKVFGAKWFGNNKQTYDKFANILVEAIGIEDWEIDKNEFEELKDFVDNNATWKSRVEYLSTKQDLVIALYNSLDIKEELLDKLGDYLNNN